MSISTANGTAKRKSLFWIASFPKSGNTWMRMFLANYLIGGDEPLSINAVGKLGAADADARRYAALSDTPVNFKDPVVIVNLRQKVLADLNTNGPKVSLVKTHCFHGTINQIPLIPAAISRGAVYVIRHPGDVALSFANHYGVSLDDTIDRLAEPRAVVGGTGRTALQFTSDWSNHAASWTGKMPFPVHLTRYEDLLTNPVAQFSAVLNKIGVHPDAAKVEKAVRHAGFEELQKQETAIGFQESVETQDKFFRSGKAGGWEDVFTDAQKKRLIAAHGPAMKRFGYLK